MAFSEPRTWVTGEVVTAAHLNQDIRDNHNAYFGNGVTKVSFVPTLEATTTNPGVSSKTGGHISAGALGVVWGRYVLSSGGTGTYFVTLPNTADLTGTTSLSKGQAVGSFQIVDDSAPHMLGGTVFLASTTTARFASDSSVHGTSSGLITETTPRTWASGDVLSFYAQYPIA